jgi:putative tryptophan/tyrosine transport system substrate-binding protein
MRLSVVSLLIGLLLLLAATSPANSAPATRVPRIGLLLGDASPRLNAFRQGLRALGYFEGQNIELDCKLTEGRYETLQRLTAELIAAKAGIIVTGGHTATKAAMDSTSTIPIVFASASDPLGSGFVKTLARPGGNATGLSLLSRELTEKRFEILHEVVPTASRIAVLYTPDSRASLMQFEETEATARQARVTLQPLEVRSPADFASALDSAVRRRADALLVVQSTFTLAHKTTLARFATTHRLPAMYGSSEFVQVGGFMSYGADALDMYRRAASYVNRILKGAKPGDLPVEQPSKFELSINPKTAKSLGLTFPASVFIRADRIFE